MISIKVPEKNGKIGWNGGAEGDRTPDLRNAIATLSQLSYGPTSSCALRRTIPRWKRGNIILG